MSPLWWAKWSNDQWCLDLYLFSGTEERLQEVQARKVMEERSRISSLLFPEETNKAPRAVLSFHWAESVEQTLERQKSSSVEPTYVFKDRSLHFMLQQESPPGHKGAEHINAFISPAALALTDLLNKNVKSNAQASSVFPFVPFNVFLFPFSPRLRGLYI